MTDRMTDEDWRRFVDEAPRLMDVLDRYEAMGRRAKCKPLSKRKRKSAAGLKVKR